MATKLRIVVEFVGNPLDRPFQVTVEHIVVDKAGESVDTCVHNFASEFEQRAFILGVKSSAYFSGMMVDDPIRAMSSGPKPQLDLPFVMAGQE